MGYNTDNFNLADWNLALPVDSTGGTSGIAATISNLTGYESPYFYDNPDGSMTFLAPVTGATTKNSSGARCELRELNPDATLAEWNLTKGGTMTATIAVNSLPKLLDGSAGKVIIGQIHGSSHELIRLYDDGGKIYFKNDIPASGYPGQTFQLTDAAGNHPTVALNQKFSYMIDAHGSTLTVNVYIGSDVYTSTTTINPTWQSDTLYFKAGVYNGDAGTSGTDLLQATGAGQTTFYGLDMSHTVGMGLGGLQAPVAQPDSFTDQANTVLTGNVLANNGHGADSAPSGLTLSVAAATVTTAHGGAVVENADGSFTYNPAANFTGADAFTYTLKDSAGLSSVGTVNITVNASSTDNTPTPTMTGTSGNDYLDGVHGKFDNVILGGAGDDTIIGHDGNDQLYGQDGNDTLSGYWGNDTLSGGAGNDKLDGGPGDDVLIGGTGNDIATGGLGHDTFVAAKGDNGLVINDFTVDAANGDLMVVKGFTAAELQSSVLSQSGTDALLKLIDGTSVTFHNLTTAQLTTSNLLAEVDGKLVSLLQPPAPPPTDPIPTPTMTGTSGNDYLDGVHGKFDNIILGGAGDDTIIGHDGNDQLYGQDGNDTLSGYWGNDTLYGGAGNDKLDGGPGDDVLIGGTGQDSLTGGSGKDVFVFKEAELNIHDIISDFNTSEDKLDISTLLGTAGTAHLASASGKIGLYVDPDGAGSAQSVLVTTFEGSSNVTAQTILHDILV